MAVLTPHIQDASAEPAVRAITHVVRNLRNPDVAEEYKRQREVIYAASVRQTDELKLWESAQSDEGWV